MEEQMTRKEKRELLKGVSIADEVVRIIKQYLPCLIPEITKMTDTRNQGYVEYHMKVILFVQILGYVVGSKSMKEMTSTFNTEEMTKNINNILKEELEEMPHYDTINDVLKNVDVDELKKVIKQIVYELIRKKMFDKYRIKDKFFQIVIDGTRICNFNKRHCIHCLKTEHRDKNTNEIISTTYYHYVLEAKLVVGNIVLSIDTEFVDNENEYVSKQDCEINAFKRMAIRLKKEFPKLPIVISGDALYACSPIFDICNQNSWQYILRFKKDRIKTLGVEIESLEKNELLKTYIQTLVTDNKKEIKQEFKFENNIHYGNATNSDNGNEVNILKFYEIIGDKTTEFMWISSFKITKSSAEEIMLTGRRRWKIENEGFNEQKNGIFNIEHLYCTDYNAMKVHYLLVQIAHMIRQLLEHGSIILKQAGFTKKEITNRIVDQLTKIVLACDDIFIWKQLRFE